MEHFRSTLATTAAIALGLFGAAHIIDPRDPALETRHSRPAVTQASTDRDGGAWSDPPAPVSAASPLALVSSAQAAEAGTPSAPTLTMMPWPSMEGVAREAPRRAERARRQRVVRAEARRSPEPRVAESTPAEPGTTRPAPAAQAASSGNPIGDLLRGLGIGRDREG